MTFTALDPKAALLVIDLQGGIVGLPLAHPADDVVSKSSALPQPAAPSGTAQP
jgi:hypothetical protein